ncbi:MAG: FAD-dependent oxidoreductase [Acidobacteria bacterium]|nr:FAD-dependent oxidoreductase [Acidobacteriota bacterium]
MVIGAGRFGREHLDTWQRLEGEGQVELAGAVVATHESRERLAARYPFPIHVGFHTSLLRDVDAVDIVTPSHTHFELARQCLPKVHVLVEKPLGITRQEIRLLARDAGGSRHVLMVNHLYRFHPVTRALQELIRDLPARPSLISGTFLNPVEPGVERLSANLELLHFFDILEYLFEEQPGGLWSQRTGLVNEVSLQYTGRMHAVLQLGWQGTRRVRTLELQYADRKISGDFADGIVTISEPNRIEKRVIGQEERPLESALRRFAEAAAGRRVPYPDAATGARVAGLALRAIPGPRKTRPRALVIGGGVFGAACALEIARHCDVLITERHSELITEASWNNSLRHHSGFHYPRSPETVQEIRATRGTFDAEYGDCVLRNVASYYCTAVSAREITGPRYLAFCQEHKLNYALETPPPGILDTSRVNLCLRTDEVVLDLVKLRQILQERLVANPAVEFMLNTEVLGGRLDRAARKVMHLNTGGKHTQKSFDYLINATYANTNLVSKWFGFPVRPLRFDLCEMMLLEIPIPKVSVTILDGPFMSMMNTGEDGSFLAYQVADGLMQSEVTGDGLPPAWRPYSSNHKVMLRHMAEYLPIIREARYQGSRFGIRAVQAFNEDYDGRPTVVTRHGFGCWSVLGGKITTCVSNAREIVQEMFPEEAGRPLTVLPAARSWSPVRSTHMAAAR